MNRTATPARTNTLSHYGAPEKVARENSGVDMEGAPSGDAAKGLLSAAEAARIMLDGIERGARRVMVGKDARLIDWLSRAMPERAAKLMADKLRGRLE